MTRYIDQRRGRFGVEPICRALSFNPSTYWTRKVRPASARSIRDARLITEIKRVYQANYEAYGARKMWKQLNRERIDIAKCTTERLMRLYGLQGVRRGKKYKTTTADEAAQGLPDLVSRNFRASRPNQLWVADLTYLRTWAGRCFLALVIDVYSRYIVGWALSTNLKTELPLEALEMAIWRRDTDLRGLIHHSDHGSQYTSIRYTEHMDDAGIAPSVGSVGDSYDNALAETTIGLYKAELIEKRGPWRTPAHVELSTLEWIEWWNNCRLHEAIDYIPPAEKEAMYYTQKESEKTLEIVGKKPL